MHVEPGPGKSLKLPDTAVYFQKAAWLGFEFESASLVFGRFELDADIEFCPTGRSWSKSFRLYGVKQGAKTKIFRGGQSFSREAKVEKHIISSA